MSVTTHEAFGMHLPRWVVGLSVTAEARFGVAEHVDSNQGLADLETASVGVST